MPLSCSLGLHRPRSGARWNDGYYFTKCTRCGTDLVRTSGGAWHVPKGYKVVWRTEPPAHRKAGPPRTEARAKTDTLVAAEPRKASADELPIQAVLRDLHTRDLTEDNPISAVDEARQAQLVAQGSQEVPPADTPAPAGTVQEEEAQAAQPMETSGETDEYSVSELMEQDPSSTAEAIDGGADEALPLDDQASSDAGEEPADTSAEDEVDCGDPVPPIEESAEVEADHPGEDLATVAGAEETASYAFDEAADQDEHLSSVPTDLQDSDILPGSSVTADEEDLPESPLEEPASVSFAASDEQAAEIAEPEPAQPPPAVKPPTYDFMEDDADIQLWDPAPPPSAQEVLTHSLHHEDGDPEPLDELSDASPPLAEEAGPSGSSADESAGAMRHGASFPAEEPVAAAPPPASSPKTSGARRTALRKGIASAGSKRKRMSFAAQATVTIAFALGVVAALAAVVDDPGGETPPVLAPDAQSTAAPQALVEAREPAFVTARILNCRVSPVAQAKSVRKIPRGSRVEILARDAEWVSISHRGRQCWVLARYVSRDEPV